MKKQLFSSRRIPEEIHVEILKRLPVKSILKCKSVCKSWYSLISKPNFGKKHLDFNKSRCSGSLLLLDREVIFSIGYDSIASSSLSEIQDDEVIKFEDYPFKILRFNHAISFVGSCNGLVCIDFFENPWLGKRKEVFCIWNPATKEFKKIAAPQVPNGLHRNFIRIRAFGYDSQIDDYKVFLLAPECGSVYTLGLNTWKNIPGVPYSCLTYEIGGWDSDLTSEIGGGVLVNEKLHWLVKENQGIIVSLDISTEKFEEMQLPIEVMENKCCRDSTTAGVLEGCLCLLVKNCEVGVETWVMQDYGVQNSWTKRYVITNEIITKRCFLKIMWSFKNGRILLMDSGKLILYDPKHETAIKRKFASLGRSENINWPSSEDTRPVEKYLESLISLNSGTYVGRGQTEESTGV